MNENAMTTIESTLKALASDVTKNLSIKEEFAKHADRFSEFSSQTNGLLADTSKSLWNTQVRTCLYEFAKQRGLDKAIAAMFDGQAINTTEGRSVLHTALRGAPFDTSSPFRDEVLEVLGRIYDFADAVRSNGSITDVVNIGIGGSDLGPAMAVQALQSQGLHRQQFHFVSNVDGHDIAETLAGLTPDSTLFIICSKTFTTRETIDNATLAKQWFVTNGGTQIDQHFVAVTTERTKAKAFGIDRCFEFWNWVGGRYSLWGAIGLSIAIAVGRDGFTDMLRGAWEMDTHFRNAEWASNIPVQLGLLDYWNHSVMDIPSTNIAPYHHGLRRLPAYLQQLEMESNGKQTQVEGQAVTTHTSPVIWGEAGTNGQHSFFQMLHQGTQRTSVEFILIKRPSHAYEHSHTILLSNALAQSLALMNGKPTQEALQEKPPTANPAMPAEIIARHRSFPGNRPSVTIVLPDLTPHSLGMLIAMYEHRVFVHGTLCNINPFDQWGVELGKVLALETEQRLKTADTTDLDASTAGLIQHLLKREH